MEIQDLDPLDLGPVELDVARQLLSVWELRWLEAVRLAELTPEDERTHGDIDDPGEAVAEMTQWIGRNFSPQTVEFFAVNISGIRLAIDDVLAGEHAAMADHVDELRHQVQALVDRSLAIPDTPADICREDRLRRLEQEAAVMEGRIAELRRLIVGD